MKPLLLATTLAFAAAGLAFAGAKKQSDVAIRFHAEGGSEGGGFSEKVALINSGREVYMQSMPLVTEREVTAFYPFDARDGSGTKGVYFKLDAHGNNMLSQHTMAHRGSYLIAFINGRHVVDLYVNRGVTDGILCVPSGLTANDIARLELSLPLMGQENIKPGSKKKKAAPESAAAVPALIPASALALQPAMKRRADGTMAPAMATGGASPEDLAPPKFSPVGLRE